jgi:hypothetical protein
MIETPGRWAPVETGRSVDVEHSRRHASFVSEAVGHSRRNQDKRPRGRNRRLVAEEKRHLALEDVKRVVFVLVDVLLDPTPRGHLDDAEVEARRVPTSGEKLDVAHPMPLARPDDYRPVAHG